MELRQLRYLVAITEEGNIGRAAQRMRVSQPAISQQLKKLEDEIGAPLFERHSRGMRLTEVGQVLSGHARALLGLMERAKEDVDRAMGQASTVLRVGVLQMLNARVMPSVVSRLVGEDPDVQIRVCELTDAQIEEWLLGGRLDLGVGFVPPRKDDLSYHAFLTEELGVVANSQHRLAGLSEMDVAGLTELPLALLPSQFTCRQLFDSAAKDAGISPRVAVECDTIEGLKGVVRQGGLCSVLPASSLGGDGREELRFIRLKNPTATRTIGLIWRRDAPLNPAGQALHKALGHTLTAIRAEMHA